MPDQITIYKSAVLHIYAQQVEATDKALIQRAAQLLGVVRPILKGRDARGENTAHWSRQIAGAFQYGGAVWTTHINGSAPMGAAIVHRDSAGAYSVKVCETMWDEDYTEPKLRAIAEQWIAAR